MSLKKIYSLVLIVLAFITFKIWAADFIVKNIQVLGLQRISLSTVLDYLPIRAGQQLTSDQTAEIIQALYQTGFFSNVSLSRQGNTLIINVVERPTIGLIQISGNKQIKTKDLLAAMKQAGIAEGLAYDQGTLSGLKQALQEQYYSLGRYNATIDVTVNQEERNRVALYIKIDEGNVAKVRQINIMGNKAFKEKTLVRQFSLTTPRLWSFFTKGDDYSRDKLQQDLDTLRSYYMDRGYLRFNIDSTQVTITPDRSKVYIAIHVTEGAVYKISGYKIAGNTLGQEAAITKLVTLKPGDTFSRKNILAINNAISRFYGNEGYAMANVQIEPTIDDATHQVFLTFAVNPGERIYVRQINFTGNTRTADYVLRQETRQMEGGLYSIANIDETKRRLNNLGYLDNIQVQVQPVPNTPDEVDLNYNVKETSSATASAQVGYSDAYGILYGASITQNNFRGTGKTVSLGFQNSQYSQNYSLSYLNPYYTTSGISRGINLYFQHVTPNSLDLASYNLNIYGGTMTYSIPMSEYDSLSLGYGYEYTQISSSNPSIQIQNFMNQYGTNFNNAKVTAGWLHSSYDRIIFPTRGFNQWIGAEAGLPILPRPLDYYKLYYDAKYYHPIYKGVIGNINVDLGYGNGYGNLGTLPFFKNFFAGGIGSVRGFQSSTLGPVDSLGNPLGGNVLADANFNLIIPNPISDRVRTELFVDGGNVYQDRFNLGQLRYSTGIEVDWWSPIGPLQFAVGKALNAKPGDQTTLFNFNVGTSF